VRRSVALCLLVAAIMMGAPLAAAASVFSGSWSAHDASLRITRGDLATETIWAYVFCATAKGPGPAHFMTMHFRVFDVKEWPASWTARIRVTRIRHNCRLSTAHYRLLHVGDVGRIRLRNGIVHERLTGLRYCDRTKARRGVCGA